MREHQHFESASGQPPLAPTDTPILPRLKAATRDLHDQVERRVGLMNPAITVVDYRRFVVQMLGFYEPLEGALAALPGLRAALPSFERRQKATLLRRDLEALRELTGLDTPAAMCTALPAVTSVADAFGCMYVLEGATLGGQVLSRHLRTTLGAPIAAATAFVRSYGADVGPMWREFGAALEAHARPCAVGAGAAGADDVSAPPVGRGDATVAAGRATFACLAAWLHTETP